MATYNAPYNYNAYPTPTGGSNTAFGLVPGQIAMPNPSLDLTNQITNLPAINASIFGNLFDQSRGIIPQGDVNYLQDQQAAHAVASGMPGLTPGSLQGNANARNLGLLSYQLRQQAAQQYPSLVGAVSQTQTVSPALQTQIAEQNAVNAAAPNPQMAQSYAQQLYNSYLQSARGPGGGTTGISGPSGGSWASQPQNQSPEPNYAPSGWFSGTGPSGGSFFDAQPNSTTPNYNWWSQQTGLGGPSGGTSGTGTTNFYGLGGMADTTYNPATDTSNYNYGVPDYYGGSGGSSLSGFSDQDLADLDASIFGYDYGDY